MFCGISQLTWARPRFLTELWSRGSLQCSRDVLHDGLALKMSRGANGVSELHGEVSREMWKDLHAQKEPSVAPIGHITNGIHVLGWMTRPTRLFWKRHLGQDWETRLMYPDLWKIISDRELITDEEIWALRYHLGENWSNLLVSDCATSTAWSAGMDREFSRRFFLRMLSQLVLLGDLHVQESPPHLLEFAKISCPLQ